MPASTTSFDLRDEARYESIHDLQDDHWTLFFEAASLQDGDVIMDAGCGYGACSHEAILRHPTCRFVIDLVDESAVQIKRAKRELQATVDKAREQGFASANSVLGFHCDTLSATAEPRVRRYDKIFLKMVLHEVPAARQQGFLDSLYDQLRPGGLLIVWDLALQERTASFFREVVREKDRLLDFASMVQRRHFLTPAEFDACVKGTRFAIVDAVRIFDNQFFPERRLGCEFKGDKEKYEQWQQFIAGKIDALAPRERQELRIGETPLPGAEAPAFVVQRAIWRLRRPDAGSVFNSHAIIGSVPAHLAPTSERADLAESIHNAAHHGLDLLGRHGLLHGHKGLIRITTYDLKQHGRRELSKIGTDYVYSYGMSLDAAQSTFTEPLLAAYYRHLAYVYHRKKLLGPKARAMTDYVNERGGESPHATYIRLQCREAREGETAREFEVSLCNQATRESVHDIFRIEDFEQWNQRFLEAYPAPALTLGTMEINDYSARIFCHGGGSSIDKLAAEHARAFITSPPHPPQMGWKGFGLGDAPIEALAGFAAFIAQAGLRYACYVLPPTPLENQNERAIPASIFFSSDNAPTPDQEQTLLAFTTKMWIELRGLELLSANNAFLNTAYRDEILYRSAERAFFLGEIVFPLLCKEKTEVEPSSLTRPGDLEGTTPTFAEWASSRLEPLRRTDLPALFSYLRRETEAISAGEKLILAQVEHDLGGISAKDTAQDQADRIERARKRARQGGFLFESSATILESVLREGPNVDPGTVVTRCKDVLGLLAELKTNSRAPVETLCGENQKGGAGRPRCCTTGALNPRSLPPFRFQLSALQAAVSALRDNADKHESPAYSLRYDERPGQCTITWLETIDQPWTLADFTGRLLHSARVDGVHRGLPCVIGFALESGSTGIELLSGTQWISIWPTFGKASQALPVEQPFNYGYRITI